MERADLFEGLPGVLVADDEELMREVVSMMLEDHGGRPLPVADGDKAIEVFRAHSDEIRFVLLDFSMPKKNGYEACCEILEIKPEVCVIILSGLEVAPEVRELRDRGRVEFVAKPFREDELLSAMERLYSRSKDLSE